MAITTYDDLQSSIASWLHRGGLTEVIPDFIALCEADFNRRLRISHMEVRATANFDEAFEDLPEDFLALREVKTSNTDPIISLQYITPEYMTETYPTAVAGLPKFYTLTDSRIRVNTIPSSTIEITYYAPFDALSDAIASNWVLANHPDVYLYGSLVNAESYLNNDKRLQTWKLLYEAALKQVDEADKKARWSGDSMSIRAG